MSLFVPTPARSTSLLPFVTSGIAAVSPPLPVLVAKPPPPHLNHSSRVKLDAPKPGAGPKVTYWAGPAVPLNCRALPALAADDFAGWLRLATTTHKTTPNRRR